MSLFDYFNRRKSAANEEQLLLYEQELIQHKNQINELTEQLTRYKTEADEYKLQLHTIENENRNEQGAYATGADQQQELILQLRIELAQQIHKSQYFEQQWVAAQAFEADNKNMRQQLLTMKRNDEAMLHNEQKLSAKMNELDAKITEKNDLIDKLRQAVMTSRENINALLKENEKLQAEQQILTEQQKLFQQKINTLTSEQKSLYSANRTLQAEASRLVENLQAREAEYNALHSQLIDGDNSDASDPMEQNFTAFQEECNQMLDEVIELDYLEYEPKLIEQEVDEDSFAQRMKKLLSESIVNIQEEEEASSLEQDNFRPRSDDWEVQYHDEVQNVIEAQYKEIRPVNFRDNYDIDYATAYAEGIIRKRYEANNDRLDVVKEQPYIGRMDLHTEFGNETYYIGSQGIENYVISWHSDAAKAYYYKMVGTPIQLERMGEVTVDYLRQIDIRQGKLVQLHLPITAASGFVKDEALLATLSQKRGTDMKQIIATLQREQYDMVTLPITKPIIVQGSAGSGKSAIALHRLSYLLNKYENLKEDSVAFIGPNEAFLQHTKNVLPSLGSYKVKQTTFLKMACDILMISPQKVKRHRNSEIELIKVKGSLSFRNYVEQTVRGYMNDVRRWSAPVQVKSTVIAVIPILREMEKHNDYHLRIRENSYYNLFFSSWHKQVEKELQAQQEIEQWMINSAVSFAQSQSISVPISEQFLLTEQITEEIKVYSVLRAEAEEMGEENQELQERHAHCLALLHSYTDDLLKQYISIIEQQLDSLQVEELLDSIWAQHSERELLIDRERHALQYVRNSVQPVHEVQSILLGDEVSAKLVKAEFEQQQQLSAKRPLFYSNKRKELISGVIKHCKYLIERSLLQQINKGMEYHISYKMQLSPKYTPYKHPDKLSLSVQEMEEARQQLKRYVKEVLEDIHFRSAYEHVWVQAKQDKVIDQESTSAAPADIYYEDLPALLHISSLLYGKPKDHMLSYLIVDEAQDYMPYEIVQLHAMTSSNGLMLIGDLGQNLNSASSLINWHSLEELIEQPEIFELKATFRSTAQIVEASNAMIAPFAADKYQLSRETMLDGEAVNWIAIQTEDEEEKLIAVLDEIIYGDQLEPVAVIVKDEMLLDHYFRMITPYFSVAVQSPQELPVNVKVLITTPVMAKGLEFSAVVLVQLEGYEGNDYDRKLAYVAASRAIKQLHIMYDDSKPLLLEPSNEKSS